MKRILLTISIIALAISNMIAGPVDQQTAQRIGEKFLKTTSLGQKTDLQLNLVSAAMTREAVDYYIFNVKDGNGFVVVAGDDRVKPILAYATTGSYAPDDVAPGFQFTLNGYRDDIRYVREHNIAATDDIIAEWKSIEQTGYIRAQRNTRTVDVLCSTLWNQGKYYNDQCPEDPDGPNGRVYAGCVATAMGQVLYYWNYPARGTGSHSYTPGGWGYPSYPTQTGNFGETEYHWELMPLQLDSTSTQEEIFYIAQLLHHLGISVEMMYSPNGSGAYSFMVPDALHNYFGFTNGNLIEKDSYWGTGYTNEEWATALKEELDQHRPLYYSGSDDSGAGGHAFVCDGYDENDYFHFNWGWDGRDNGYCAIGALNTTKYAFNQYNDVIIDLYPEANDYFSRPEQVKDLALTETSTFDGVTLQWINPALDLEGNALTELDTLYVRRNFQVVAVFPNPEVGATMTFTDNVPENRLYEYSVYATNQAGASVPVYEKILIGEKCNVVFQLSDEGGDGWKGAAISVTDDNNNRIAVITMEQGSQQVIDLPLLKEKLHFIWNHGWFHSNEQYDTDFECSFTLFDFEGNEIYSSPEELTDGPFFTYDNLCGGSSPLVCYPVQNLEGEYVWNQSDDYGGHITWDVPEVTEHLDHFQVMRNIGSNKEDELIAEIPFDGNEHYDYFDNLLGYNNLSVKYSVNCVFIRDDEQCESDKREVLIDITGIEETNTISICPNPTQSTLTIKGEQLNQIEISNRLGQRMEIYRVEGSQTTIDMSRLTAGLYFLTITDANGQRCVKKVMKE